MTDTDPKDRMTMEQARAYAAQSKAIGEAERNSKPLPETWDGTIPAGALPPDADPDYVARMLARAERSQQIPDVVSSKDFQGKLPPVNAATLDPRSQGMVATSLSGLQPNGTISYGGTRIGVEHAVKEGLLVREPNGGYRLPSSEERAAERQGEQQQEQQHKADAAAELIAAREDGHFPDQATQAVVEQMNMRVPGQVVQAIILDAAGNGSLSLANVHKAAERAGMTTEQGEQMARTLWDGFARQAATAAMTAGVPAEQVNELWQWSAETQGADHKLAAHALVQGYDATPIKRLAKLFLAHKRGNQ